MRDRFVRSPSLGVSDETVEDASDILNPVLLFQVLLFWFMENSREKEMESLQFLFFAKLKVMEENIINFYNNYYL